MRTVAYILLLTLSAVCTAQEVEVSTGKNSVILSVSAQKPYELVSGEKKTPVMSVHCVLKGKKDVHIVTFAPGGAVIEDKPEAEQVSFTVTMGTAKHLTTWVNFGDAVTFAFYGKQEPERIQFINALLDAKMVSIDFSPFLTGQTVRSTFDLSKLRAEMAAHPECAFK